MSDEESITEEAVEITTIGVQSAKTITELGGSRHSVLVRLRCGLNTFSHAAWIGTHANAERASARSAQVFAHAHRQRAAVTSPRFPHVQLGAFGES